MSFENYLNLGQIVVSVDEATNTMFYLARDGDNFMKTQLHRVGLDGRNDRRLTDPAFNHTISASPDSRYFVDVAQTHDTPPASRLIDAQGRVVADLASSDTRGSGAESCRSWSDAAHRSDSRSEQVCDHCQQQS